MRGLLNLIRLTRMYLGRLCTNRRYQLLALEILLHQFLLVSQPGLVRGIQVLDRQELVLEQGVQRVFVIALASVPAQRVDGLPLIFKT